MATLLLALALPNLKVRKLAYDNLFIFYWRIYRIRWEILTFRWENLSPYMHLSMTSNRLWMTRHILYFLNFKMKTKISKFKILQRMHRKFPAIQQKCVSTVIEEFLADFDLYYLPPVWYKENTLYKENIRYR
jgi:hypothetical protein